MGGKIDKAKVALIHLAKHRLDLDDDAYRAVLRRAAHVESSLHLDDYGFGLVMAEFERLGFKSDFASANLGNRLDRASPAQVAKIKALWSSVTGGTGTDAALDKWLARQFKISSIRFLTPAAAHRAIGALSVWEGRRTAKLGRAGGA